MELAGDRPDDHIERTAEIWSWSLARNSDGGQHGARGVQSRETADHDRSMKAPVSQKGHPREASVARPETMRMVKGIEP